MTRQAPIENQDKTERCQNCRFWLDLDDAWAGSGACRRYPPTDNNSSGNWGSGFPKVGRHKWCGEYQAETGQ